jgi:hypothetical protein
MPAGFQNGKAVHVSDKSVCGRIVRNNAVPESKLTEEPLSDGPRSLRQKPSAIFTRVPARSEEAPP